MKTPYQIFTQNWTYNHKILHCALSTLPCNASKKNSLICQSGTCDAVTGRRQQAVERGVHYLGPCCRKSCDFSIWRRRSQNLCVLSFPRRGEVGFWEGVGDELLPVSWQLLRTPSFDRSSSCYKRKWNRYLTNYFLQFHILILT